MVELVFYPFIIGFGIVVLVLAADTVLPSKVKNRSMISGSLSSLAYASFLYVSWRLWQSLQSGVAGASVPSDPFSSTVQVNFAGLYVFFLAAALGLVASVYSIRYMINYRNAALFHSLLALLGVSIFGVVVSGDLLTLFIFWEGMSLCAYSLVAFRKTAWEALEASIKYLLMAGAGSLIALFGIAIIYSTAGTLNLQTLSSLALVPSPSLLFALALIVVGFGVEAAIAPLHTWLPDAYPAAPSPVSAMLSGIVTATGSFTILRVLAGSFLTQALTNLLQPILVVAAVVTMLVGNLSAYHQDDLKRLLAFSSVAQVGYVLLGISTFTVAGLSASIFQIWNQGLLKGLFFLLAGTASFRLGTQNLTDIAGIGRKTPLLGLLLSLNALAMTGVPPFGMFWSEILLLLSALATGSMLMFAGGLLMLMNIALSIAYYFRIIRRVSFDTETEFLKAVKIRPSSWLMTLPCLVLVGLSLATGFLPGWFYAPAYQAIQALVRH